MLIIILGSPNDANGKLLPFAVSRCQQALKLYNEVKQNESCDILCTGGFGEHFNTTELPHGQYLQRYLINQGIDKRVLLPVVESRFTIEDASLSGEIIKAYAEQVIAVISSDFHMKRVKAIFTTLYQGIRFKFISSFSTDDVEQKSRLIAHEQLALLRDLKTLKKH